LPFSDRASALLVRPRGTDDDADSDVRGAHSCACRRRSGCHHAGGESMPASRQRRRIASPDVHDCHQTSVVPSDAHHL